MRKPWEHPEDSVPEILKEWGIIKAELNIKYSNRDSKGAAPLMKRGISYFYEMLFWGNGKPVMINDDHSFELEIKPVNVKERLDFILSHINNYHSYIQLSELFTEMEKLFSKYQAMKKSV